MTEAERHLLELALQPEADLSKARAAVHAERVDPKVFEHGVALLLARRRACEAVQANSRDLIERGVIDGFDSDLYRAMSDEADRRFDKGES